MSQQSNKPQIKRIYILISQLGLNSDITLIVGCSIKYIDSDQTLKSILLACRDFNETLSPAIYKQALLRTD